MSYRLKSNVIVEPLVANYFASPYLLSPLSAPRFLRRLVLKLFDSFVNSPKAHELALKNPAFKGGPFVALLSKDLPVAKELYSSLKDRLSRTFSHADAFDELHDLLKEADGESLDSYYDKIPLPLQGLVELFYERSGKASYRMIEALTYRSVLYDEGLQSIIIRELDGDNRDFVLTTPRLETSECVAANIPLSSIALDNFLRSRDEPVESWKELAMQLGIDKSKWCVFESFFEEAKDSTKIIPTKVDEATLRCRYFGHACVEVSSGINTVVMDPLISYDVKNSDISRLSYRDLPEKIDALVITHLHLDHFNVETLINLRHKVDTVVLPRGEGGSVLDPSGKMILKALGFKKVVELDHFEEITFGALTVQALPFQGEHGDLNITSKAAYIVKNARSKAFFGADIRLVSEKLVQRIAEEVGSVDSLYLGMECEGAPLSWVYGALLDESLVRRNDQQRRLNGSNSKEASFLLKALEPRFVNIYALGKEPWLSHIMSVNDGADSYIEKEIQKLSEYCELGRIPFSTLAYRNEENIS
ncbi:MBL fold metallo-hydrolase [bacterium]|nr:MBL fold metallo-hydrolase [bacterium]